MVQLMLVYIFVTMDYSFCLCLALEVLEQYFRVTFSVLGFVITRIKKLLHRYKNFRKRSMDFEHFANNCGSLYKETLLLKQKLETIIFIQRYKPEDLTALIVDAEAIVALYQKFIIQNTSSLEKCKSIRLTDSGVHTLFKYRCTKWIYRVYYEYRMLLYLMDNLLVNLFRKYEELFTHVAIRLIKTFNVLLHYGNTTFEDYNDQNAIFRVNIEKFTLKRILKILADERGKICALNLVENLYSRYVEMYSCNSSLEEEEEIYTDSQISTEHQHNSDNTSIVVYKTLTRYLSPSTSTSVIIPATWFNNNTTVESTSNENKILHILATHERSNLLSLFKTLARASNNELIDAGNVKICKKTGYPVLRRETRKEISDMYEQMLWAKVGILSEHILLWWSQYAVGINQLSSQRFKMWLQQASLKASIPETVLPVVYSLVDCLQSYIISSGWDELFRQAIESADYDHAQHTICDIGMGTKTGHLFSDLFYDFVYLNNDYVNSCWMSVLNEQEDKAQNLPLAEHIPLLHRLDHSVHIARLWAVARAKYLTNNWNMVQFFRVTYTDVNAAVHALSQLKLPSDGISTISENQKSDVHFMVCFRMRIKLISEINTNIAKFQSVLNDSLLILASVCRVRSLAQLRICFPNDKYWSQMTSPDDQKPSEYVDEYLDDVLNPILTASVNLPLSAQKSVSKLILTILCESWLDHLYKRRIKFSEWGAIQLLTDFNAVPTWLERNTFIGEELQEFLISDEILRRCTGVGHLLLRKPGELLSMTAGGGANENEGYEENQVPTTLMPPEMYVTNQQQWLSMRISQQKSVLNCC